MLRSLYLTFFSIVCSQLTVVNHECALISSTPFFRIPKRLVRSAWIKCLHKSFKSSEKCFGNLYYKKITLITIAASCLPDTAINKHVVGQELIRIMLGKVIDLTAPVKLSCSRTNQKDKQDIGNVQAFRVGEGALLKFINCLGSSHYLFISEFYTSFCVWYQIIIM